MVNAVKLGDMDSGHDGFAPTAVITASSSVKADGMGLARVGDALEPHDKPNHPSHPRQIVTGSSSVFINGKPAARHGDLIDCGGTLIGGGSVNIG